MRPDYEPNYEVLRGSQIAALFSEEIKAKGQSTFISCQRLWELFSTPPELIQEQEWDNEDLLEYGNLREPHIIQHVLTELDGKLLDDQIKVHRNHIGITTDALVKLPSGKIVLVEAKTTGQGVFDKWCHAVPLKYQVQGNTQLGHMREDIPQIDTVLFAIEVVGHYSRKIEILGKTFNEGMYEATVTRAQAFVDAFYKGTKPVFKKKDILFEDVHTVDCPMVGETIEKYKQLLTTYKKSRKELMDTRSELRRQLEGRRHFVYDNKFVSIESL